MASDNAFIKLTDPKTCTQCRQKKPFGDFYRDRGCRGGRRPECKTCSNKRIDRCHSEKHELRLEYSRRTYYRYGKKYRENKLKRMREDPSLAEHVRLVDREHYRRNTERMNEYARAWYREHKEVFRMKVNLRRARMMKAEGSLSREDWRRVLEFYGDECLKCGGKPVTIDHVVPISRGGRNDISNVQPLCGTCNARKFVSIEDYRMEMIHA